MRFNRQFHPLLVVVLLLSGLSSPLNATQQGDDVNKTVSQSNNKAHGRNNFILQCQGCHKADGSGIEGQVPDLTTNAKQFLQNKDGRRFYVTVPGSANAPLTDQQLADVLNYIIESLIDDNQGLALFSAAEVTEYRADKLVDPALKRQQLLKQFTTQ